jgi:glycosyltransferase involved in cell wall biosynthesis
MCLKIVQEKNMPNISIIIPVSVKENHLDRCLEKIRDQDYGDHEVIIAIDGPTEKSYSDLVPGLEYSVIKLGSNKGPGYARNAGARHSKGRILLFIDSDILLPGNALSLILDSYKSYPDISGVVGLYSENNSFNNFLSIFKNLQVRFEESNKPDFISNFRSALFSITKERFELVGGFDENIGNIPCEDHEFSLRVERHSLKFHLNRKLEAAHEKKIHLWRLLRQDMKRVKARLLIDLQSKKNGKINYSLKLERPLKSYLQSVMSVICPILFLVAMIFGFLLGKIFFLAALFLLAIFLLPQFTFLLYLIKRKGLIFTIKGFVLIFIEMLIAGCVIMTNIIKVGIYKNATR